MTETAQASTSKGTDAPTSGWRFRAGVTIFVLGGEFWDKVRSLFVHGARAVFPSEDGKGGRDEG